MNFEEQASRLQRLKEHSGLDKQNPRDRLLVELTDTVSLLCHQIYSVGAVVDGLNETLEEVQELLSYDDEPEEDLLDYYDGKEVPLYEVKCPSCNDSFAVDEQTLHHGFACPNCGEKLIMAE